MRSVTSVSSCVVSTRNLMFVGLLAISPLVLLEVMLILLSSMSSTIVDLELSVVRNELV